LGFGSGRGWLGVYGWEGRITCFGYVTSGEYGVELEMIGGVEGVRLMWWCEQVPGSEVVFLDATNQEEAACPDKVHLFFTGSGKVCGIRTEGNDALDIARIRPILLVSRSHSCTTSKVANTRIGG
jgi:exosome complex RNA-binding protein Rrp42 (RNase PH superfamily)